MEKKVLIGIPSGSGLIPAYVVDGLYKMVRPIPTSLLIIERQGVEAARNYIIEMAIRMQVDYLLFLDDDGVVPVYTLACLLESDKDIVGAPMMTRNHKEDGKHGLCCFEKFPFKVSEDSFVWKYQALKGFNTKKTHLHKVDAIGGACMLVKRAVFEEMFKKYNGRPFETYHELYDLGNNEIGTRNLSEDIVFSERAYDCGFEIWVDTRVRPVHLGKPKFVRFEQKGEKFLPMTNNVKSATLLSESLKQIK